MSHSRDEYRISHAESYRAAIKALNDKDRPPAVLRMIMNAFESYRQSRKLGWSRPWNKYGVRTFRSYRLDFSRDAGLIDMAARVLAEAAGDMPPDARAFVGDLLDDRPSARGQLMGFIFYNDVSDGDDLYEGVTLSFGRKNEKRHRDRLDILLEAPLRDGAAGPLGRLRIFVDPFRGVAPPLWTVTRPAAGLAEAPKLLAHLSDLYSSWEGVEGRLWDHWTSAYIDYFGPRSRFIGNSHFPFSLNGADDPAPPAADRAPL